MNEKLSPQGLSSANFVSKSQKGNVFSFRLLLSLQGSRSQAQAEGGKQAGDSAHGASLLAPGQTPAWDQSPRVAAKGRKPLLQLPPHPSPPSEGLCGACR